MLHHRATLGRGESTPPSWLGSVGVTPPLGVKSYTQLLNTIYYHKDMPTTPSSFRNLIVLFEVRLLGTPYHSALMTFSPSLLKEEARNQFSLKTIAKTFWKGFFLDK